MNEQAFEAYLEDGRTLPDDAETRELVSLMQRIESLETPDPGQTYWHHFNARLNQRLAARPKRRWTRWLGWSALPAAALLIALVFLPERTTRDPFRLSDLSNESLTLLSATLPPLEEPLTEQALSSLDWSLLVDEEEDLDPEALLDVDPEALKTMWN